MQRRPKQNRSVGSFLRLLIQSSHIRKISAAPPFANHHPLYAEIFSNDTVYYCLAPSLKPTCHLVAGAALVASLCQVTALWPAREVHSHTPWFLSTCSQPALHFLSGHWCCGGTQCVSQGQGHLFPLTWRGVPSVLPPHSDSTGCVLYCLTRHKKAASTWARRYREQQRLC